MAKLAARQHGVVARGQLKRLGYGTDAIDYRIGSGRLHVVHRGVYAVGHVRLATRGHWMAAVLACGQGALLSHHSAAALWGIARIPTTAPGVTAPRGRRQRAGLRLHSAQGLTAADRALCDGIPVTSVPRTLLDLAPALDRTRLARVIEEAERLELFDLQAVDELLARSQRRAGAARLRDALAAYREPAFTRSELERRFLRLIEEAGLPKPSVNAFVAGHEIDVLWKEVRFGVELDGYEFHRTRRSFEEDRRRDDDLALAGFQMIRLTWRRVASGAGLGSRLRRHLERRRQELGL